VQIVQEAPSEQVGDEEVYEPGSRITDDN